MENSRPYGYGETYFVTTGQSNQTLSERLASRRQQQLDELDELTQRQLKQHENDLRQLLSDAQRTTESAIRSQNERLTSVLSTAEKLTKQQIESIEKKLATAAAQAERLSRVGGIRSWRQTISVTVAVMLAVGGGGLLTADRLIDSRSQRLDTLNQEIQRAESMPRLPKGAEIRTIQGVPYLVGIDPDATNVGTIDDGQTPVIRLTRE